MYRIKKFFSTNLALIFSGACLLSFFAFIQSVIPAFCDPDSYYHAAVSNLIKNSGLRYPFPWTEFSVFKNFFSDKDFLFHLCSVPFFYLTDSLIIAGKYATIFYNVIFIAVYAFILRKHLPDFLAAIFLFLPVFSSTFIAYFFQFRSYTFSNILTLLAIYFMLNKRFAALFIVSLIYPLTHISFFMLFPFVIICETIRFCVDKDFSLRNIYTVLIGVMLGMFIHPNFPGNFLSFHLNGVLVPFYTLTKVNMSFGGEFNSPLLSFAFVNNFPVFFAINFVLWCSLLAVKKYSLSTFVWLAVSNIYLLLSFSSNRYWYPVNVFFFVFLACYVKDLTQGMGRKTVLAGTAVFIGLFVAANLIIFPKAVGWIQEYIIYSSSRNSDYENAAYWMKRNIPERETIYHSSWADSPFFMCYNPKNKYISVLDPIYMFYGYPKAFLIYQDLAAGRIERPYEPLREVFKVGYGYTRKTFPLYYQIIQDRKHFRIVWEDKTGIIFKLTQ